MADQTEIAWCDSTFNPWEGCQKVGPGCDHCYAEARNARFGGGEAVNWGPGAPRRRTSPANWRKPLQWNDAGFRSCNSCGWRGEWKESFVDDGAGGMHICPSCQTMNPVEARRRVFCASLADVFDNEVDPQWRADLFDLIRRTPNLDWLLLTKRIGNVRKMVETAAQATVGTGSLNLWLTQWAFATGAPANVWLGATVVNQEEADRDIPKLLATPARVRFLSMEPLLGPVNLTRLKTSSTWGQAHWTRNALTGDLMEFSTPVPREQGFSVPGIDWVIVGAESGNDARPMHPAWARSLRDQCAAAGVPFLFKQWGEWMPIGQQGNGDGPGCSDFPGYAKAARCVLQLDGEVRDAWPAGAMLMRRIGKKAAGRQLDGVTHDGFPEVQR